MNKRIVRLRKELKLTQTAFGERIGLSRDAVAAYERGIAKPTGSSIQSIISVFNVNRHWLETGEGDIFNPVSDEDMLRQLVGADGNELVTSFARNWLKLDPERRKLVNDFINSVIADYQLQSGDAATAATLEAARGNASEIPAEKQS